MTARLFASTLLVLVVFTGTAGARERDSASPHRIVCKSEKQTGTHFKQRVCKTRQEWDEIAARSATDLRNVNNSEEPGVPFTPPPDSG